jgi:hypothetical protein
MSRHVFPRLRRAVTDGAPGVGQPGGGSPGCRGMGGAAALRAVVRGATRRYLVLRDGVFSVGARRIKPSRRPYALEATAHHLPIIGLKFQCGVLRPGRLPPSWRNRRSDVLATNNRCGTRLQRLNADGSRSKRRKLCRQPAPSTARCRLVNATRRFLGAEVLHRRRDIDRIQPRRLQRTAASTSKSAPHHRCDCITCVAAE